MKLMYESVDYELNVFHFIDEEQNQVKDLINSYNPICVKKSERKMKIFLTDDTPIYQ